MKYPYFRGLEADRYSFYRVPKALIKVDLFEKMSGDAKLLYAVLLDRMNLSLKNGWQDENGNAYIICTIDEIMDSIRCARQKAVKLLDELEHEYGCSSSILSRHDPKPENMPILGDLYDCLREQKERQAQRIATALEIYVNGSLRVFNHQTNVELDNRLICFDIKELGKQLKKLGMLIVQDQVWNRVTINRNAKKNTRYYIDEFHLLLKEEQTAAYSVEIWKRFRKWGGIPTGITQNIKDLLASREIENIFENSDFIYMLNQASGDRQILAKQLNISPFQLSYVTNSNEGEGLLFYGNTIIPFKDKFDTSLKLYGLMTTKPNEIAKYREKKDA